MTTLPTCTRCFHLDHDMAPMWRGGPSRAGGRCRALKIGERCRGSKYRGSKRYFWTVAGAPFKEAHFATCPPRLIKPCVLACAPRGGMVLYHFGGAGTTGLVAARHGRRAILPELNPDYAAMARRRIDAELGERAASEMVDCGRLFGGVDG